MQTTTSNTTTSTCDLNVPKWSIRFLLIWALSPNSVAEAVLLVLYPLTVLLAAAVAGVSSGFVLILLPIVILYMLFFFDTIYQRLMVRCVLRFGDEDGTGMARIPRSDATLAGLDYNPILDAFVLDVRDIKPVDLTPRAYGDRIQRMIQKRRSEEHPDAMEGWHV